MRTDHSGLKRLWRVPLQQQQSVVLLVVKGQRSHAMQVGVSFSLWALLPKPEHVAFTFELFLFFVYDHLHSSSTGAPSLGGPPTCQEFYVPGSTHSYLHDSTDPWTFTSHVGMHRITALCYGCTLIFGKVPNLRGSAPPGSKDATDAEAATLRCCPSPTLNVPRRA